MRRGATQPDTHWAQQETLAHLFLFCLCLLSFLGAAGRRLPGRARRARRPLPPLGRRGGGFARRRPLPPLGRSSPPPASPRSRRTSSPRSSPTPRSPSRRMSATPSPSSPPCCCRRRREWTSSPSPSPPATPPRFVLPIRHPNLPTTAGHGACRSDATPTPRPLLAGPRCRTAPPPPPASLQVGAPGCPAGRQATAAGELVAWSLEAGAPCCLPGGRRPLDPAPSEGLFKIVVYMVHDFGHIIDY